MTNRWIGDDKKRSIEYTRRDIQRALELKAEGNTLVWLYSDYAEDIDKHIEERTETLKRLLGEDTNE